MTNPKYTLGFLGVAMGFEFSIAPILAPVISSLSPPTVYWINSYSFEPQVRAASSGLFLSIWRPMDLEAVTFWHLSPDGCQSFYIYAPLVKVSDATQMTGYEIIYVKRLLRRLYSFFGFSSFLRISLHLFGLCPCVPDASSLCRCPIVWAIVYRGRKSRLCIAVNTREAEKAQMPIIWLHTQDSLGASSDIARQFHRKRGCCTPVRNYDIEFSTRPLASSKIAESVAPVVPVAVISSRRNAQAGSPVSTNRR
eukprot:284817975_5